MPDSGNFARSVQLVQLSLRVIAKDKKLLFFPTVGFVFALVIYIVFFPMVSAILSGVDSSFKSAASGNLGMRELYSAWQAFIHELNTILHLRGYISLLVLALGAMFFTTFVNVAFYHEIIKAMAGEGVSLRRGFALAYQRIQTILACSLFPKSSGSAGAFVIPVMLRNESSNPFVLLRSSAAMIRKADGEFLIGYVGIQLLSVFPLGLILAFMLDCVLMLVLPLAWTHNQGTFSAIGFLLLMPYAVFINMVDSIFRCALYVYASEGVVPEPYSPDMMDVAWKIRKV